MVLDTGTREAIADQLADAYRTATPIAPLRDEYELTLADAYAIQERVIDRRRDREGDIVGYKVGFTSDAVQERFDVDEPAYGALLEEMVHGGRIIDTSPLIDPQIEPEITFVLEAEPRSARPHDVLAATRTIVPVIEIVDSRTKDWDVTATEAVADGSLAARLLTGPTRHDPDGIDLPLEGVQILKNGEQAAAGVGAAVLEHPSKAVSWLVETLADHDTRLKAGDIVSTGSITAPIPIEPGDTVACRFTTLGEVHVQVR
ncbi:MAG: 2-keto-4-pentenoate hydratase [Halobacteriales archaeon]